MAGVIKFNPRATADQWEQIGKKITWFTVTLTTGMTSYTDPVYPADPVDQAGWETNGALQAILAVIQKTTTIIAMGPVQANGDFSIAVEGIFTDQDNFNGTTGDGDLKRMQDDIQGLGTIDGGAGAVVMTATVVTSAELIL